MEDAVGSSSVTHVLRFVFGTFQVSSTWGVMFRESDVKNNNNH